MFNNFDLAFNPESALAAARATKYSSRSADSDDDSDAGITDDDMPISSKLDRRILTRIVAYVGAQHDRTTFCLVCRDWALAGESSLWAYPSFASPEQLAKFLRTVAERPNVFAPRIRGLRFTLDTQYDRHLHLDCRRESGEIEHATLLELAKGGHVLAPDAAVLRALLHGSDLMQPALPLRFARMLAPVDSLSLYGYKLKDKHIVNDLMRWHLRELSIIGMPRRPLANLGYLLYNLRTLRGLRLESDSVLPADIWGPLAIRLSTLQHLRVCAPGIRGAQLVNAIGRVPTGLRVFHLVGQDNDAGDELVEFILKGSASTLQSLVVHSANITAKSAIMAMTMCPHLTHLELVRDAPESVGGMHQDMTVVASRLHTLCLRNLAVPNQLIQGAASVVTSLHTLHISGASTVIGASLGALLASSTSLVALGLRNNLFVGDEAMVGLAQSPCAAALQALLVENCGVQSTGIEQAIPSLPNIRRLAVMGTEIVHQKYQYTVDAGRAPESDGQVQRVEVSRHFVPTYPSGHYSSTDSPPAEIPQFSWTGTSDTYIPGLLVPAVADQAGRVGRRRNTVSADESMDADGEPVRRLRSISEQPVPVMPIIVPDDEVVTRSPVSAEVYVPEQMDRVDVNEVMERHLQVGASDQVDSEEASSNIAATAVAAAAVAAAAAAAAVVGTGDDVEDASTNEDESVSRGISEAISTPFVDTATTHDMDSATQDTSAVLDPRSDASVESPLPDSRDNDSVTEGAADDTPTHIGPTSTESLPAELASDEVLVESRDVADLVDSQAAIDAVAGTEPTDIPAEGRVVDDNAPVEPAIEGVPSETRDVSAPTDTVAVDSFASDGSTDVVVPDDEQQPTSDVDLTTRSLPITDAMADTGSADEHVDAGASPAADETTSGAELSQPVCQETTVDESVAGGSAKPAVESPVVRIVGIDSIVESALDAALTTVPATEDAAAAAAAAEVDEAATEEPADRAAPASDAAAADDIVSTDVSEKSWHDVSSEAGDFANAPVVSAAPDDSVLDQSKAAEQTARDTTITANGQDVTESVDAPADVSTSPPATDAPQTGPVSDASIGLTAVIAAASVSLAAFTNMFGMSSKAPKQAPSEDLQKDAPEVPADDIGAPGLPVEEPAAEEPVAEKPVAEKPVAEEPVAEEPTPGTPIAEEPNVEVSATEITTAEELAAEVPATEVAAAEVTTVEEPAAKEPTAEAPATEEPVVEEPAAEEPAAVESAAEEPTVGVPTIKEPAAEEPAAETPAIEEPAAQVPAAEDPVAKGLTVEEPTAEAPATEEPVVEEPAAEEPAAEAPIAEEPTVEVPAVEVPAAEVLATEAPTAEEPAAEEPAAEEPAAEVPDTEVTTVEEPAAVVTTAEKSVIIGLTAEEPAAQTPAAEEPTTEELAVEEPAVEVPDAEVPDAEVPAVEESAVVVPATEVPVAEVPAAKEPAAEAPITEEPTVEMLAAEVPVVEELDTEESAAEALAAEVPAAEEPATEAPTAEESVAKDLAAKILAAQELATEVPVAEATTAEEPAAEATTAEEPAAEEPIPEEPTAEESAVEAPIAEEPAAQVPAAEEPITEEPAAKDLAAEEPATEEPTVEEPTVEAPAAETSAAEEPAAEELAAQALAAEEPAAEELISEAPATEEPATEELVVEEPAAEKPVAEEPTSEAPATEEPAVEEPVAEEPAAEEPAAKDLAEEPAAEAPAAEEPAAEEPAAEEPAAEEPAAEEPAAKDLAAEKPATEELTVDELTAEAPIAEVAAAEVPAAIAPAAEEPAAQAPAAEAPTVEEPAAEELTVEESAAKDLAEEPAAEEPAAEEPAAKDLAAEKPATEELTVEEPAAEVPAVEAPTANIPAAEVPAVKESATEEPTADVPVAKAPIAEESTTEEPAAQVPAAEAPIAEEPVAKDLAVEEPDTEEPAIEEPVVEEPATEAPITEEPTVGVPAAEVPVVEVPAVEEPAVEEPAAEEPAAEDPVAKGRDVEEPAAEELTTEASIAEELTVEVPVIEEPATEEPAVVPRAAEIPATEAPSVDQPSVVVGAASEVLPDNGDSPVGIVVLDETDLTTRPESVNSDQDALSDSTSGAHDEADEGFADADLKEDAAVGVTSDDQAPKEPVEADSDTAKASVAHSVDGAADSEPEILEADEAISSSPGSPYELVDDKEKQAGIVTATIAAIAGQSAASTGAGADTTALPAEEDPVNTASEQLVEGTTQRNIAQLEEQTGISPPSFDELESASKPTVVGTVEIVHSESADTHEQGDSAAIMAPPLVPAAETETDAGSKSPDTPISGTPRDTQEVPQPSSVSSVEGGDHSMSRSIEDAPAQHETTMNKLPVSTEPTSSSPATLPPAMSPSNRSVQFDVSDQMRHDQVVPQQGTPQSTFSTPAFPENFRDHAVMPEQGAGIAPRDVPRPSASGIQRSAIKRPKDVLMELNIETPRDGRKLLQLRANDDLDQVCEDFCLQYNMAELLTGMRSLVRGKVERRLARRRERALLAAARGEHAV